MHRLRRPRHQHRRTSTTLGALFLSLFLAAPAALLAQASPAGADLGAPDRPSVPALIPSQPHALPGDATNVRIDMTENDGLDVIVQAAGGGVSAPGVPSAAAVRFHQTAGTWEVDTGPGCAGPWTQVSANQTTPTASPVGGGLLTLCVASGSPTVHGTLTALYNSLGQARSVNTLPLEQYVADTVPGESPSSWAGLGGAGPQGMNWGFQELEAQAVAVRSYVLANPGGYGGYADTCDLTCQTYRGIAVRDGDEHGRRQRHRRPGDGDARRSDRHHRILRRRRVATPRAPTRDRRSPPCPTTATRCAWPAPATPTTNGRRSVSFATVQATWPQIGTFTGFGGAVFDPGRPDNEASFGRVDTITLDGTGAPSGMTIPGTEFYVDLGLKSDLFSVTSTSNSTVSIEGQGWGHGIGMGQWGALGYAIGQDNGDGNWTYQQIVDHYYGPAQLTSLPGGTGDRRSERRRRRVLDQRRRRGRVQLRQRAVLRQHGRHATQPARRRHGVDARRRRVLGGGQ